LQLKGNFRFLCSTFPFLTQENIMNVLNLNEVLVQTNEQQAEDARIRDVRLITMDELSLVGGGQDVTNIG
jgi:hypothetical protein